MSAWAGISWVGATPIVSFDGKMNATGYIQVLEKGLIPFMANTIRDPRFMQDNDPKHTSKRVGVWLKNQQVNWWKTPPESPDLNPIENLWHEMKEYIRREIKPKTKDELVSGINQFWSTVDIPKCKKYINHLKRVAPKIIELEGNATGY